jgi:hypothetical protein
MGEKVENFSTEDVDRIFKKDGDMPDMPKSKKTVKHKLFSFDPTIINWKFKTKRGNRRLKVYIKMKKDETEQWETVKKAAKPPEMSDGEFARILFYKGIHAFMSELSEHVNNMSEEDKQKLIEEHGLDQETEKESASDE